MKRCTRCGVVKPLADFNKSSRAKDGTRSQCKTCVLEYMRKRGYRKDDLKYKYGMVEEDYEILFRQQGGSCAICRAPSYSLSRPLMVDHCHKTGRVRGLLCCNCNFGIGNLQDDPKLLAVALAYLLKEDGST